jgi:hypothetical protein
MPRDTFGAGAPNWIVIGDQIDSEKGGLRLKMIGAVDGVPQASFDAWASSTPALISFLEGAVEALKGRQSPIAVVKSFRQ